jgi:hypothetical protein
MSLPTQPAGVSRRAYFAGRKPQARPPRRTFRTHRRATRARRRRERFEIGGKQQIDTPIIAGQRQKHAINEVAAPRAQTRGRKHSKRSRVW